MRATRTRASRAIGAAQLGGPRPWAIVPGLAIIAVLAGLDAAWDERRIIASTVVVGPFVTAIFGTARQTVVVAVAAIATILLSGFWNDNLGTVDYFVRLVVVAAGAAFAVIGASSRMRLQADRVRFRLLRAVAAIGDGAPSVEATGARVCELLVPSVADVCVVDVVRRGGAQRVAVRAAGPRAAEIEDGLRRRRIGAGAPALGAAAVRSGEALLIAGPDEELLQAVAGDPEDLAFLRSLGGRAGIVVPLGARGRSIGTLALVATDASGRTFDADDAEFARLLAGRVALTLDNAGLFSELESLEAQHTAALANLVEAVTIQDADGRLVYANDAAARTLGFASPDELLATPPQDIVDQYDTFLDDGSPLRLEDLPGRRVLGGEEPGPLLVRAIHRGTGEERWRVLKASAVRDRSGRPRMAVNVLEDVTEVKKAEMTQRFLAQAGELLSSSLETEQTLAAVARLAVPELADWCGVSMPDEHGFLRSVATAHSDPEKVAFARDYDRRFPVRLSAPGGAPQVLRDGRPQVVNHIPPEMLDEAVPDPEQRAAIERLGMRAVLIVPMHAASGVIGTISLVQAESGRTFSPADLELAQELGRRAGTAVENARLYTERSHIARTLQRGLLPDALPDLPGFAIASLYRPAGRENLVGGDFYDAFSTPGGWMLTVGDVTGRGAEAAALTAQARHTLRTAGMLLDDPQRAIEVLNRALAERAELSIVTAAVARVTECDGRTVATIVAGGHPAPLLIRAGEVSLVEAGGPVVGAWPDSTWAPVGLELLPGDLLVLYTDGVTDAVGTDGRFGEARLEAALRGTTDAAGAITAIHDALEAFERGPQADDTAVVAVHRDGPVAPAGAGAAGAAVPQGAR